jgi:hypothetical protein
MRRPSPILFAVTIALIVSLACVLPSALPSVSVPTLDPNSAGTAIMQTMVVALTQTGGPVVPVEVVPTSTSTPEPTLSPTITLSPTLVLTATPLVPLVSVSVDTNCRVGPGQVYERVGALLVGETVQVYGMNPTGRYWYVQNPDEGIEFCWLWGEYATISGNFAALPVFTPPPTPTPVPMYTAGYSGLQICSGWWVDLQLTNTGGTAFRSLAITIKDTNNDENLSLYADRFTAIDDCVGSTTKDVLGPNETLTVSVPAFSYDPSGHKLRATITLCTATGQKGACITEVVKFSP